jgi:hypothetical protein
MARAQATSVATALLTPSSIRINEVTTICVLR